MDIDSLRSQISLDRHATLPLYRQLERQLNALLDQGALAPGDRIPGDVELAQALGINTRTVRQGLAPLVERGVIERIRRAGTFVTHAPQTVRPTIGFFYFQEASAQMLRYAQVMQSYAARLGADLKIMAFFKDFFQRVDLLEEARRMQLQGLIVTPLNEPACEGNLQRLEKAGFPYVRFSNAYFLGQLQSPLIWADWPRAVRHALRYLWSYGHRRIGIIYHHQRPEIEQAYAEFAAAHGAFPDRWRLAVEYDGTTEMLYSLPIEKIFRTYFEANPELTAVCATILGRKLIALAPTLQRPIPERLSIINFEAFEPVNELRPTAMDISAHPMGEAAAYKLFELIYHPTLRKEEIIHVPFNLIEGDTVTAPPIPAGIEK